MTKLKNTKKGMAKKALSISLVAAMLATSNVPVWAAEDLFSDGSAAVEAPVVEEPAAEVDTFSAEPVEEAKTNDVATYSATSDAELTISNEGEWNDKLVVKNNILDVDGKTPVTNFDWKVYIDGAEVVTTATGSELNHTGSWSGTACADVNALNTALKSLELVASDTGKPVTIKITKGGNYVTTIGPVTPKAVNIDNKVTVNNVANLEYTGKQVEHTEKQIEAFTFSNTVTADTLKSTDFVYEYQDQGEGLVNATVDASKRPALVATIQKTGYVGTVKANFNITKKTINEDDLEVTLNKDAISYVEYKSTNTIPSEFLTIKDTKTGDTFPASTYTVTPNTALNKAGDSSTLKFDFNLLSKDELTNRNYTKNVTVITNKVTGKVNLTANSISDFRIETDTVRRSDYIANKNVVAPNAIHFYLGDKDVSIIVRGQLNFAPETATETSTSVSVAMSGNNQNNVLGNTTATINLTSNKIEGTINFKLDDTTEKTASKASLGNAIYTGEKIERKISNVRMTSSDITVELKEGTDYKIVYEGDCVNYTNKDITVKLVGIGEYSGSVVLGTFRIEQAEITADSVTVPKTVQYDGRLTSAADYMSGKVTVKAKSKVNGVGDDKLIDVPAEAYNATFKETKLEVGGTISTTISAKANQNFKGSITKTNATTISNKDLSDENVKIEVVGGPYTYTGKAVIPTLKVTVDGVELAPDRDYEVKATSNSIKAGDATVTVVGKGDYSGSQLVKYVINKANLADVKAEAKVSTTAEKGRFMYTGSQVKPVASDFKITLNGVTLDSKDFAITYPTSSYNNVEAGEATVSLVPVKGNTNFTGDTLEVKFNILPRDLTTSMLNGSFLAYDENGDKIDFNKTNYVFGYDGTEKTFKNLKFVPTKAEYNGMNLVEGKDYEIRYYNNVTGPNAYVYVVGIGNYASTTEIETGSTVKCTVKQPFTIDGVAVGRKNVVLKDTEYGGGIAVSPNLTIKVGEKTLVEGVDYEFIGLKDNVEVTPDKKLLTATLKLKGGYKLDATGWTGAFSNANATNKTVDLTWKIVKKDLANTTITAVEEANDIKVTVMNGNVIVPEAEYDVKDNGDGTVTVTAKGDSKGYTGSQKVSVEENDVKVGAPVITEVQVNGNKATVILDGETDGATGYDYVISTVNNYTDGRLPDGIHKNQLVTETTYQYLDQGIYYVYCHAWTRDENGKKVFGEWSNIMPFSVSAITPEKPVITSVKKSGRNLTVTWTKSDNATGYDIVMGTEMRKVNGELRPVEYGKAVKKITNGNTVTVTFRSIPKGTYYVGLHAYNRTSETGVKVFSPWSNAKKVTF